MSNKEEQQVIDLFSKLLDKYDKLGTRDVRDGHTRVSLFGEKLTFDLSKSFPLFTHRQFFMRGIFEELSWMLSGSTDNKVLEDKKVFIWSQWNNILHNIDSNISPTELGNIYGYQWRNFGGTEDKKGFDQITWLLSELKNNPYSSRLILNGWNPNDALVKGKAVLPACHAMFQLFVEDMTTEERVDYLFENISFFNTTVNASIWVRTIINTSDYTNKVVTDLLDLLGVPSKRLSSLLYQRSSDISIAGGYNVAQYALLTHMFAQHCNYSLGKFDWTLGDVHLYGNQIEDVREMVKRPLHDFPKLVLKEPSDFFSYTWEDIQIQNYKHSGKMSNLKVAT